MNSKEKDLQAFILERFSPLAFSEKPLPEEEIKLLFEAARWAPSAFNEQPWRFIYATKNFPSEFNHLLSFLVEGNRVWAKNAPFLGISLTRVNSQYNGKPNKFAFHDLGLAMGGLLAQATSMGIKVHQMGGFSVENAREGLLIPKEYEPVAMFAVGYYGKPDELPEDLRKRELAERKRKPLGEIVSLGSNFA